MSISARDWNQWLARLRRSRLLDALRLGRSGWKHPWFTSARWNAQERRWEARVKPGMVNGRDPTVRVLEGQETRDVGLAEITPPALPLTVFRVPAPAPALFTALGVRDPQTAPVEGGPRQVTGLLSEQAATPRQLRACDIVLHQPRPRMEIDVVTDGLGGAAGAGAQFAVRYTGSVGRPFLRVVSRFIARPDRIDLPSLVTGALADPGEDTRRVSTVYLLSPEGETNPDAEPDERWRAFAEHGLFWNLAWHSAALVQVARADNLTFNLPLAGGLAGPLINQMLSQINDANSALAQFLAARDASGRFWSV